VRGNGKIIQELEAAFRGAGWNAIKVIWGDDWDPLLAQDDQGLLVKRMEEVPDGQYQMYSVAGGDYIRRISFGRYPQLAAWSTATPMSSCRSCAGAGTIPRRCIPPIRRRCAPGAPTVILAKTIKGYGLGEAGEGRNVTHQQKKLNEEELRHFSSRFDIPIPDDQIRSPLLPARRQQRRDPLPERTAAGAGRLSAGAQ
jgi:pyruvate dehydrogenase E1 component